MPRNKQNLPIEELSKNELITRCKHQRKLIQDLEDKNKRLERKCNLLNVVLNNTSIERKLMICMQETMSYIEDVEDLKNQIRKLKGEL